ncbi:MAG: sigma-70 family RNA polymerase sigma factor [bacterium]|nr:sigma-70 family RNA polymerase sigma factor [bacterium]
MKAGSDDRAKEEARWASGMRRAQEGDAAAYRALLTELDGVLRAYLTRVIGEASLAEDGVHETLIAVHKARHTWDSSRPFRPWLMAIARHKAIDVLRRGRNVRDATASHVDEERVQLEAEKRATEENRPEAALEVDRLLARLPDPFREAIVLTKLEGRTVEDAARQAAISTTAMRSRVHRAMRELRRWIEEEPL